MATFQKSFIFYQGKRRKFYIRTRRSEDIIFLSGDELSSAHASQTYFEQHVYEYHGRPRRYEGNVMTWVRPSNYKLIDRTIRYVDLLTKINIKFSYETIAKAVFDEIPKLAQVKHWC